MRPSLTAVRAGHTGRFIILPYLSRIIFTQEGRFYFTDIKTYTKAMATKDILPALKAAEINYNTMKQIIANERKFFRRSMLNTQMNV